MGFLWEYLPFRHRGNVFICHDLLSIAHLEAFHRTILIGFDTWNMVKNCRMADGGCVQPHGCWLKAESKPYLGTLFGDPLKIWGVPSKFSNWIRIEKSGEGSNHQRLIPRTSGNSWSVHVQTVPMIPGGISKLQLFTGLIKTEALFSPSAQLLMSSLSLSIAISSSQCHPHILLTIAFPIKHEQ